MGEKQVFADILLPELEITWQGILGPSATMLVLTQEKHMVHTVSVQDTGPHGNGRGWLVGSIMNQLLSAQQ